MAKLIDTLLDEVAEGVPVKDTKAHYAPAGAILKDAYFPDEIIVWVARGDKTPADKLSGLCNGDIIAVFDPLEQVPNFKITESMCEVYEAVVVDRKYKEKYQLAAEHNALAAEEKRTDRKQFDVAKPELTAVKTIFNTVACIAPVDLKKYDDKVIIYKVVDAVKVVSDLRLISSSNYTYGSGGNYATRALAYADVNNLTGNLTLTSVSDVTETSGAAINKNFGGFVFTDNGAGYVSTYNVNADSLTFTAATTASTINLNNMIIDRSTSTLMSALRYSLRFATGAASTVNITNCFLNGRALNNTSMIRLDTSSNFTINFIKSLITGFSYGTDFGNTLSGTRVFENCTFVNNSIRAVSSNNQSVTLNSCTFFNNGLNFQASPTNSVSNNCATDKASVGAATNNSPQVNLKLSEQFYSLDYLHPDFGRPKLGSACATGGATPTLSSTDYYGQAWSNPAPIGLANYTAVSVAAPTGLPAGTKYIALAVSKSAINNNGSAPYLIRMEQFTGADVADFWTTITGAYQKFGFCLADGTILPCFKDSDCFDVGNKKGSSWIYANLYNVDRVYLYYGDSVNVASSSSVWTNFGLIRRFGLNEASGTTIVDDALGQNGTISGTYSLAQVGQICRSVSFTAGQITLPDRDDLSFTDGSGNDTAHSVWNMFNPSNVTGSKVLFGKQSTGSTVTEYLHWVSAATYTSRYMNADGAGNRIGRITGSVISANVWQLGVSTKAAGKTDADVTLSINGIRNDTTSAAAGTYTGMSNTAQNAGIASHGDIITLPFVGLMDELWIQNRVATPEEIYSVSNGMLKTDFTNYEAAGTIPASGGAGGVASWLWYRMYQRAKARRGA